MRSGNHHLAEAAPLGAQNVEVLAIRVIDKQARGRVDSECYSAKSPSFGPGHDRNPSPALLSKFVQARWAVIAITPCEVLCANKLLDYARLVTRGWD